MLQSLTIKNFALIENLEWTPSSGFNIITGETGAGKSIILGAIGLLTGDRADTKVLLNENEKCVVEGVFAVEEYNLKEIFEALEVDYDAQTTIRREIAPGGKSRAFINDTPTNLEVLKEITSYLIDVHSQHQNLLLGKADFQLKIIDTFAAHQELLNSYKNKYREYKQISRQLEELQALAGKSKKEQDYETFLLNELIEAKLEEGEQDQWEQELNVLENAEEIKIKLNQSIQALAEGEISVQVVLGEVLNHVSQISKLSELYAPFKDRISATLTEIKDLSKELEREESKVEADPERANFLRERLNTIYKLQKKHGVLTIGELIALQIELQEKVNNYNSLDTRVAALEERKNITEKELKNLAVNLSENRVAQFTAIESNLLKLLDGLGMPSAAFMIKNEPVDFTETGTDRITLLFSANKGINPAPISKVASGGEFSRVMFALKYLIASKSSLPTLIFDEIDTGISGEIAMKMGEMMQSMAGDHQLITITHLHQIAAKGDAHYYVFKEQGTERTKTNIKKLKEEERIMEIAQMIGGKNPSPLAFESAKELLQKPHSPTPFPEGERGF